MADTKVSALTALSVPALEDLTYAVDDPSGTPTSRSLSLDRLAGLFLPALCQGRLTTETGVPMSTSDRTSQSTIYFTPYSGNRVALYDGTRWKLYSFTERSLALSGLTSGKNYDVFLYDNAGTLTLELSAAWTNDTTRADALTTQDGIYVKSGATTRRYVGTIRTTSTTTTEDSVTKRFLWNAQHRCGRAVYKYETTASWTCSSTSWRQARATSSNQVEVLTGLTGEASIDVMVRAAAGAYGVIGIGEDSTTTLATGASVGFVYTAGWEMTSVLQTRPAAGYHAYVWLEKTASTSSTMYGDDGVPNYRYGLQGLWEC